VDGSGVFIVNLWLSPQGIWYYRKVTVLPCGRRKKIKKSLHTRDKLVTPRRGLMLARSRAAPRSLSTARHIVPLHPTGKPVVRTSQMSCFALVGAWRSGARCRLVLRGLATGVMSHVYSPIQRMQISPIELDHPMHVVKISAIAMDG